jgi:hypothetical protein
MKVSLDYSLAPLNAKNEHLIISLYNLVEYINAIIKWSFIYDSSDEITSILMDHTAC